MSITAGGADSWEILGALLCVSEHGAYPQFYACKNDDHPADYPSLAWKKHQVSWGKGIVRHQTDFIFHL